MMDLDIGHYARTGDMRSKNHGAAMRMITYLALAIADGEDLNDKATKCHIVDTMLGNLVGCTMSGDENEK